ncbi:MAG: DUF5665 domain-containing protein [bacterium]
MKLDSKKIQSSTKKVVDNISKVKNKNTPADWSHKTAEQKLEVLASMLDKAVLSYPHLIKRSFIAGIFTGLGATVGVTVVFALIVWFLSIIGGVPFLRDWLQTDQWSSTVQNLNPKK